MPIYVYQCQSCHAVEEHIQRMGEAPVTECSACGGALARSLTSAAFHLKGGGWYKDGYASTGAPAAAGESSTSSKSDSGSSSKSDTGSSTSDSGGSASSSSSASAPS